MKEIKMNKIFPLLIVSVTLSLVIVSKAPVRAWTYPDDTPDDTNFETFGPRADKLIFLPYSKGSIWGQFLGGETDLIDPPVPEFWYESLTTEPEYIEKFKVVPTGVQPNIFMLDMNTNNNPYLGNPQDPSYPNPVYPNPMSEVGLRRAIDYLIDRDGLVTNPPLSARVARPLYTIIPSTFPEEYILDICGNPDVPWAWQYSPGTAELLLDASGFPMNEGTGWRFWDRNGDGLEQTEEKLELIFYVDREDPVREYIGDRLVCNMEEAGIRVKYEAAYFPVIGDKNFHLYTGYWEVRAEPTHTLLWSWDCYFHPGHCPNYGGHNNPEFNEASGGLLFAADEDEAVTYALQAQMVHADDVLGAPILSTRGYNVFSRTYAGGEPDYSGLTWQGIVNIQGHGIDNDWSYMNMHPDGYERGTGDMTIREGFIYEPYGIYPNPIYNSLRFGWKIMSLVYDTLLKRDPYTGEFIPNMAETFECSTYEHRTYGTCSKVTFKLRPDVYWSDGTPLTATDVFFTFVELRSILSARELPRAWWSSNVEDVLSFRILDPYNFEVLLDVESMWALSWVSDNIILPKHIWKPIAETDDPTAWAPDPNMIGSGPWRFKENVDGGWILMMANKPGSTIQTDLPGSTQVESPHGYFRYHPTVAEARVDGATHARIGYGMPSHTVEYVVHNSYLGGQISADVVVTYANGSTYSETVFIGADGNWTHLWEGEIKGKKTTSVTITITSPLELAGNHSWTHIIWSTINEDITGSTLYDDIGFGAYPYKSQLRSPDIKVDMRDIGIAAAAFGSYPGHERWGNGLGDVNKDYKIDMRDLGQINRMFGWKG